MDRESQKLWLESCHAEAVLVLYDTLNRSVGWQHVDSVRPRCARVCILHASWYVVNSVHTMHKACPFVQAADTDQKYAALYALYSIQYA